MNGIRCGPQRAELDPESLVEVGPPPLWARQWPHRGGVIELIVDGDLDEPHPQPVELAGAVLPGLETIELAADAYLRAFIDAEQQLFTGPWRLNALILEWSPAWRRGNPEFTARLSIRGDDYGEWRVTFMRRGLEDDVFSPYVFSRRQW